MNLSHIDKPIAARKAALTYVLTVGAPVAILLAVIVLGEGIHRVAIHGVAGTAAIQPQSSGLPNLAILMTQIGLIVLMSRAVGSIIQRIGQPRVIGEVLAGLLLGPSFLGWIAPGLSGVLFPVQSLGFLHALSQLGLVLFMFMVGLEVDVRELYGHGHAAVVISHASIMAPMALGAALSLYLYPRFAGPVAGFAGFALFMGVAMSITAFPVLARILTERKLLRSRMGAMAIACAAIGDATGWCVLAYVVAFVSASHSSIPVWLTVGGLPVFIAITWWAGRWSMRGTEEAWLADGELSGNRQALLLVFLLAAALATEALGLHLLFGAFVAGAIIPKHPGFGTYLIEKFEPLTVLLLLPLFFAYTGLRTSLGQIRGAQMWGICLLIIAVAVAGKLGGTGIAARLSGFGWRESLALGSLMNTRGLMELVVLNIGLDIGIITPAIFSMMVVMAITTTMMAPPLLDWFHAGSAPAPGRQRTGPDALTA